MKVPTVLYVENDPVALTMYQKRLEREGFHLETATDGMEALQCIAHHRPDVLMLDLMLPNLSGADVLRFVLASPELKPLPIVIFSNAPKTEIPEEVTLNGTIKFLSKADCPFPTLLQTIHQVLGSSHADSPIGADSLAASGAPAAAQPDFVPQPPPAKVIAPPAGVPVVEATVGEPPAMAPVDIGMLRQHCFSFIKSPASAAGLEHLASLQQSLQWLRQQAESTPNAPLAMLTTAFSALLSDIAARPATAVPAVLQTIAQAMDCLDRLTQNGSAELPPPLPPPRVLAVDDDPVCNHVMARVLKRGSLEGDCVLTSQLAFELASAKPYDLVLLDVDMPGMSGFELCEKLRRLPQYKTTPIIFLSAHNNFENRKQSVLSGAHDFIVKPVIPCDLVLKITVLLLKHRAQRPEPPPAAKPALAMVAPLAPALTAPSPKPEAPPAVAPVPLDPPAPVSPTPPPEAERKEPLAPPVAEPLPVSPIVAAVPLHDTISVPEPEAQAAALPSGEACPSDPLPRLPEPLEAIPPIPAEPPVVAAAVAADPTPPVSDSLIVASSTEPPAPADPPVPATPPAPALLETTNQTNRFMQKGQNPAFDKIVNEVARLLFGDENLNEINLRLVRMALEGAKVHELVKPTSAS